MAASPAPAIREGARTWASDRVRIAVVGVRGRGREHVSELAAMPNVEIAAICDVDSNVAGPAMRIVQEKQRRTPQFTQDFRRVLADRSIDAVSIATPNHWHSLQTIWACQAGKDVYVEKPVSHNMFEGRRAVEAARKYERIVQAGTQSRSSNSIREAIAFVRSGKLGKLLYAQGLCYKRRKSIGHYDDEGLSPPGVDYNLWLGPAAEKPFNRNRFHYEWHWNWDYGNGDLGNQGIHQMDVIRWGIGKNELPGSAVSLGGRFGYKDDGETPNTQIVWMEYGPKDPKVLFEVRGLETEKERDIDVGVIFHCADGFVALPFSDVKPAAYSLQMVKLREFTGQSAGPGRSHFANFVDCVISRRQNDLAADIQEGHLSSALCHVANISYRLAEDRPFTVDLPAGSPSPLLDAFERTCKHLKDNGCDLAQLQYRWGRSLKVDPRTERFFDNDDANGMVSRDYRLPFFVPQYV
ncbi:MAG: Gfo/Idh/MocA family protein [Tepidisphaerales bacterium]